MTHLGSRPHSRRHSFFLFTKNLEFMMYRIANRVANFFAAFKVVRTQLFLGLPHTLSWLKSEFAIVLVDYLNSSSSRVYCARYSCFRVWWWSLRAHKTEVTVGVFPILLRGRLSAVSREGSSNWLRHWNMKWKANLHNAAKTYIEYLWCLIMIFWL